VQYIKLGTTGLDVSPIAIGAMTYGDPQCGHPAWSLGEDDSRPLIKHALEAGINFFDTANMYSQGSSEEILGRALRDFADRDDIVIATKLRHPMRSGPNGKGLSRKAIMTEVDHSLHRLGTDFIDLYQIHRNDHRTSLSKRPWKPSTTSSRPARCATSVRPRCRRGNSPRPSTFNAPTGGHGSCRCRTTTTCSPAKRNAR
jgi:aryl-alcohol dehydrogenase-like predicted oxidoreductase